jgi:hypothetical protein
VKNKFPVLKIILPVSSPKIPCCDLQGISSKVAELSADSSGDPCCNGRILVKFPVFFPVSTGMWDRDWFDCDCVRHHTVLRKRRFPGSVRIAPNWRRFVHAFCLCNLPIELRGPFSGSLSLPWKIAFPDGGDRCWWRLGSNAGSVGWKAEHLALSPPFGR